MDIATDGGVYTMWLYWVLTCLLIIGVFAVWYVYIRHKFRKMRERALPTLI